MRQCDVFICASHPNHPLKNEIIKSGVSITNYTEVCAVQCRSVQPNVNLDACRNLALQNVIDEIIRCI